MLGKNQNVEAVKPQGKNDFMETGKRLWRAGPKQRGMESWKRRNDDHKETNIETSHLSSRNLNVSFKKGLFVIMEHGTLQGKKMQTKRGMEQQISMTKD
ncbi:MAG: hypothetical protein CM15mP65_22510 [Crocinitomicaceae bacterium]|nr:MAG: hypothetical protein CM15mP65_22510 [Crocinitomicaceae bacterium]